MRLESRQSGTRFLAERSGAFLYSQGAVRALRKQGLIMTSKAPQISVILPTYNERENVSALAPRVLDALYGVDCEVIVVDDGSPDGTGEVVREMGESDSRVRLVQRGGKAGLSSAVFAGAAVAQGPFVAVLDADLSHDPEELPGMLAKAEEGYDVVVGSRFVAGAGFDGQPMSRQLVSLTLNLVARALLLLPQRDVLTGYALCRREVITGMPTRHSAPGFKWLLESLATQRELRVYEWPVVFRNRCAGSSKAGAREAVALAGLCARMLAWRVRQRARRLRATGGLPTDSR